MPSFRYNSETAEGNGRSPPSRGERCPLADRSAALFVTRPPGLGSGQPEAGLTTAGNPVHRSSGGRCPASLKLISPGVNPGR